MASSDGLNHVLLLYERVWDTADIALKKDLTVTATMEEHKGIPEFRILSMKLDLVEEDVY